MTTEFKNELVIALKKNRPKLSANSLKTYVSTLTTLNRLLDGNSTVKWFSEEDTVNKIMEYLKSKTNVSRKTFLSACYVLTTNKVYHEQMIKDATDVNDNYKLQNKSVREEENWVTPQEIDEKYNELYAKAKLILSAKAPYDQAIMNAYFMIASFHLMIPRRSMEYSLLKLKNYDEKTDNYYKSGKFYFNQYKTAYKYGLQIVDCPKELNDMIKKYLKINNGEYLLQSKKGTPINSSAISKIFNGIFAPKKVSVDMIRHIYLSDKYKNLPELESMLKTADAMGHSLGTALQYVKKNSPKDEGKSDEK